MIIQTHTNQNGFPVTLPLSGEHERGWPLPIHLGAIFVGFHVNTHLGENNGLAVHRQHDVCRSYRRIRSGGLFEPVRRKISSSLANFFKIERASWRRRDCDRPGCDLFGQIGPAGTDEILNAFHIFNKSLVTLHDVVLD